MPPAETWLMRRSDRHACGWTTSRTSSSPSHVPSLRVKIQIDGEKPACGALTSQAQCMGLAEHILSYHLELSLHAGEKQMERQ